MSNDDEPRWAKNIEQQKWIGDITVEELSKHNLEDDCWCSFQGSVYNLTPFLGYHPGGISIIMRFAGQDMTEAYNKAHKWVSIDMISKCKIGTLVA